MKDKLLSILLAVMAFLGTLVIYGAIDNSSNKAKIDAHTVGMKNLRDDVGDNRRRIDRIIEK